MRRGAAGQAFYTGRMRAIVVGFGKMGMLHAATLRMLGVGEVAICESSPLVREGILAFAPASPVFASYQEALRTGPVDLAVIATPTASHAPIFRDLATQVRGIFVEKPFAVSAAAAIEATATLSEARRSAVMVGHCLRFAIPFMEAQRYLEGGAIGAVQHVEATMFSSDVLRATGGWRSRSNSGGGGVLLDLGSHLVDMVRALFGTPRQVRGSLSSIVSRGTEDAFRSEWRWEGFDGTVEGSWSKPGVRKATLEIAVAGSRGRLVVSDDVVVLELREPTGDLAAGAHRFPITELEQPVPFDLAGPMYARQLAAWVAAIEHERPAPNGLDENIENLRLIDLIRRSNGELLTVAGAAGSADRA